MNDREIYYIDKFDTFNAGYNLTEGGEGSHGFKHTTASRKKQSTARFAYLAKNPGAALSIGKHSLGKKLTAQRKAQLVQAHQAPEHRQGQTEIARKAWEDTTYRATQTNHRLSLWQNPAYQAYMSARHIVGTSECVLEELRAAYKGSLISAEDKLIARRRKRASKKLVANV